MNEKTEAKPHDNRKKINSEDMLSKFIFGCVAAAVCCIIIGVVAWAKEGQLANSSDFENAMDFLRGTTASFWALAGVFIIFVAFLIQSMQFTDQRKQFKIQTDSVNRQNFENSFFQLLSNHNQILLGMRDVESSGGYTAAERETTGRDCFKRWYKSFDTGLWGFEMKEAEDGTLNLIKKPKDVIEKYVAFYEAHQGELGHYFRNLYHLIKFVNESDALNDADLKIEYENRRRYTSLVRATLSQFELALLFYNCVSPLGKEKFKPLVVKFGLLKNFNTDSLLKPEDEDLYEDDKAFE
jgi:hypothetical protein